MLIIHEFNHGHRLFFGKGNPRVISQLGTKPIHASHAGKKKKKKTYHATPAPLTRVGNNLCARRRRDAQERRHARAAVRGAHQAPYQVARHVLNDGVERPAAPSGRGHQVGQCCRFFASVTTAVTTTAIATTTITTTASVLVATAVVVAVSSLVIVLSGIAGVGLVRARRGLPRFGFAGG